MKSNHITINDLPLIQTCPQAFDYLDSYQQLWAQTQTFRTALVTHPIYRQINNLTAIKIFMRSHIFAVWGFMTLPQALTTTKLKVAHPKQHLEFD
jgi:hypothetical protein